MIKKRIKIEIKRKCQLLDIRVNNIVNYEGPLGFKEHVIVKDISDSYEKRYTLTPFFKKGEFIGYNEHIRPVFLSQEYLLRMGFQHDENSKQYTLNNLIVDTFYYNEKGSPQDFRFIGGGFRINQSLIVNDTIIIKKEKDSLIIPYLHSLQNYCDDVKISGIDFTLIDSIAFAIRRATK